MQTNMSVTKDEELHDAADALMEAAMRYWRVYQRAAGGAAVVWVKDSDGRMVILTRGEYQQTLMRNIDSLHDGSAVLTFEPASAQSSAGEAGENFGVRLAASTVIDFEDTIAKAEKARSAIFELEQCLRNKNEIAWERSFMARIEISWVLQFAKERLEAEKHVAANALTLGATLCGGGKMLTKSLKLALLAEAATWTGDNKMHVWEALCGAANGMGISLTKQECYKAMQVRARAKPEAANEQK